MNKLYVISERSYMHWPSYDLVYEWEDEMVKHIEGAQLYKRFEMFIKRKRLSSGIKKYFGLDIYALSLFGKKTFRFDMSPSMGNDVLNTKNASVCIVDFYLTDDQLPQFYHAYRNVEHLYVSSREVYEHLQNLNPPRKIEHLPLTLPDKYLFDEQSLSQKEYDLVLVGRQNPVLQSYLEEYAKTHELCYVTRGELKDGHFPYFTNKGEFVGNMDSREDYFKLLRKAKIALYSTPGVDGGEERTHGYSQVTPRFLEQIACGCHVISRYKRNADTDYFDLDTMSTKADTYLDFETAMDNLLTKEIDVARSKEYLTHHYTSTVCAAILC